MYVKDDDLVDDEWLRVIFEYGGKHGIGAERSSGGRLVA
jgi:hypothetical protein